MDIFKPHRRAARFMIAPLRPRLAALTVVAISLLMGASRAEAQSACAGLATPIVRAMEQAQDNFSKMPTRQIPNGQQEVTIMLVPGAHRAIVGEQQNNGVNVLSILFLQSGAAKPEAEALFERLNRVLKDCVFGTTSVELRGDPRSGHAQWDMGFGTRVDLEWYAGSPDDPNSQVILSAFNPRHGRPLADDAPPQPRHVRAAGAATGKLLRLFTPEMLGSEVPYFETVTGPARTVSPGVGGLTHRDYKVDGCDVTVHARGTTISALGLRLTRICTFDPSKFLHQSVSSANQLTFGRFAEVVGADRFSADCLSGCGNAFDPSVYLHWEGPRALGFVQFRLQAELVNGPALDASTRWREAMERRERENYVIETTFNCDGRYNATAARFFHDVKITHLFVGTGLEPEGCDKKPPQVAAASGARSPAPQSAPATGGSAQRTRVGPSFDCASPAATREPLPQLICMDAGLARLDLAFIQAFQALRQQVGDAGLRDLRREAVDFQNAVVQRCGLPRSGLATPNMLARSRNCLEAAYRDQRRAWFDRLVEAARQEAERPLERHVALQDALQRLRHLPADANVDGVYGPATRNAIVAWQESAGRPSNPWLSDRDAAVLEAAAPDATSANGSPDARVRSLEADVARLDAALRQSSVDGERARQAPPSANVQRPEFSRAAAGVPAATYMIFFDPQRADLTARSREVIAEAAAAAARVGGGAVTVAGHDDRYGTPERSRYLSEFRAAAVVAQLVEAGVPRDHIASTPFGDSRPLAGSEDGVRNPQNRRVEIVIARRTAAISNSAAAVAAPLASARVTTFDATAAPNTAAREASARPQSGDASAVAVFGPYSRGTWQANTSGATRPGQCSLTRLHETFGDEFDLFCPSGVGSCSRMPRQGPFERLDAEHYAQFVREGIAPYTPLYRVVLRSAQDGRAVHTVRTEVLPTGIGPLTRNFGGIEQARASITAGDGKVVMYKCD